MKVAFLLLAVIALLAIPPAITGQGSRIEGVDPGTGKVGDVIGAKGEALGKAMVVELYLTDGSTDIKVPMVSQTDTLIQFKVPASAKPGKYNLMIKTAGASPKLLEQPVKVEIEG